MDTKFSSGFVLGGHHASFEHGGIELTGEAKKICYTTKAKKFAKPADHPKYSVMIAIVNTALVFFMFSFQVYQSSLPPSRRRCTKSPSC